MADTRLEGEYALDRGNPLAEPIRVLADWAGTVPVHHRELSSRGGVINREKKCLASRGGAISKGWTLLA